MKLELSMSIKPPTYYCLNINTLRKRQYPRQADIRKNQLWNAKGHKFTNLDHKKWHISLIVVETSLSKDSQYRRHRQWQICKIKKQYVKIKWFTNPIIEVFSSYYRHCKLEYAVQILFLLLYIHSCTSYLRIWDTNKQTGSESGTATLVCLSGRCVL